ncbi:MAG: valine--tRNA ligase, partial [Clostridia bacterium]|nr:valine--tRNA ligase [Clostridia bacterium]
YLKRLAWVSEMSLLGKDEEAQGKTVSAVSEAAELFIPLGDLVDIDKEIARLNKDLQNAQGEVTRAENKLSNQGFVAKAPAALIEQEKAKLEKAKGLVLSIAERIKELESLK